MKRFSVLIALLLLVFVQSLVFADDSDVETVDLSINIIAQPSYSGGGGSEVSTSRDKYSFESQDGIVDINVSTGTIIRDENGKAIPNSSVSAEQIEDAPNPPSDTSILGMAYDFQPSGATFSPAIDIVFTYDPDSLPYNVVETELQVAFYDEDSGEWVILEGIVNPDNNTITVKVSHFTTFAVLAPVYEEPVVVEPEPVEPEPEPTPVPTETTPIIEPTPEPEEPTETPDIVITIEPEPTTTPTSVVIAPEPKNYTWLWVSMGIVLVIGIGAILFVYYRGKKRVR